MSLRLKIFATFIIVTLASVMLVTVLVSRRFTSEVSANLAINIDNAEEIFQTVTALNFERLLSETSLLSQEPRLRASLSTLDVATISETVSNFGQSTEAPLLLILSPKEKYLTGWGLPSAAYSSIGQQPVITDAMNGFEAGDYWKVGDDILMVSAAPVNAGTRRLGIVVLGRKLDASVLESLEQLTSSHFALVMNGAISENTTGISTKAFSAALGTLENGAEPAEFLSDGDRFIGATMGISSATNEHLGNLTIYQSLDSALEALDPLRASIYAIALISMIISLLASYQIARGVTRPLESLMDKIDTFGSGHYEEPVEVYSNDEVGLLASSFEDMRQSLLVAQKDLLKSEKLSTLGQMANGIIHDFKQPMTSIQGYTELLCLPDVEAEKRTLYAETILTSIQQMSDMIRDLLDFSKGEAALHLEPVDFNSVVREAVETFSGRFDDQAISLEFVPGDLPQVRLDRLRIQRVIENLIGNASDAVGSTGTITLLTQVDKSDIALLVEDSGGGVPVELRETLFEPFVTMGKASGTGLGLAIAKNIVEEHGGIISFETDTNSGTRFRIALPVSGLG